MKVVISIGGSIIASPINPDYIKKFSALLTKLRSEGYKPMVVVGGGRLAREYIAAAKELGASDDYCDEIGIATTRMNAMLLVSALGSNASKNIQVTGGIKPGQTTDAVAAELAGKCKAKLLVIATNVAGVYDSDPNKNPSAKKFDSLTSEQLLKIVGREYHPGLAAVIDPIAAKIIHRNKIKTIVIDGRKLKNIENAIKGKRHGGTVIE
ncbi:MAG: UMP kinase [Candidatus Hydrothermarchaeota archaeon]|nr:UMP kinase [Candidatus Hydrothermarchaeota archaeon]